MNETQYLQNAKSGGLVKMTKTKEQVDRIKMMKQVAANRERKKEQGQARASEVQLDPISVEAYEELKRAGMTDVDIMKKFDMHNADFYEWKNQNGLIRRKRADSKKEEKNPIPKAEDSKLIVKEKYDAIEKELSELYQKYVALGEKHEELSATHEKVCVELQTAKKVSESIAAYYEGRSKGEDEKIRIATDSEVDAAKQKIEELEVQIRELEEGIAVENNEKNKHAAECSSLLEERLVLRKEIAFLQDENKRLNRLKTYLYEDNLKVIEHVGLRLENKTD